MTRIASTEVDSSAAHDELVLRAGDGDRSVEAALCARFAPAVRIFARRRLRTQAAVEDFTQDVLLTFLEALRGGSIDDPARAPGFVLGICRNLARERARVRDRRASLFELYGETLNAVEAHEPAHSPRELAHLEDCLSQLAQRSRDVLRHAFVAGDSSAEIAETLSMNEGHVRVVRHRALDALRDCMSQPLISWEAS